MHEDLREKVKAAALEYLAAAVADAQKRDYIPPSGKKIGADDLMRPDCLEKLVGYMLKHPETDVAFGDMEYVDAKGDSLGTRWSLRRPGLS